MSTGMQSVSAALEGVAAWAAEQEQKKAAEIVEVDSQIAALREEIASLGEKLGSLETLKSQLQASDPTADKTSRGYQAIFASLQSQADALQARAKDLAGQEKARLDKVIAELPNSPVAEQVTEFEQFKTTVEPTLAALPESYRDAMRSHHDGVVTAIRRHFEDQLDAPVTLDGELLTVDLVYGIDAPEGQPELLVCVLPMHDGALTAWADRDEDVQTLLGARVVQAIYETSKAYGPTGAQVVCGGHKTLLAVEVDLLGAKPDFEKALPDNLHAVLASAPELASAKIRIKPTKVDLDFLLPEPEEE